MTVKELMRTGVLVVRQDDSLDDVCALMQQERIHAAPVVDESDELVGMITQSDLLFGMMTRSDGDEGEGARVGQVMTSPPVAAPTDIDVTELCALMWRLHIHHIPIVDGGQVVGIVSSLDLCRVFAEGRVEV